MSPLAAKPLLWRILIMLVSFVDADAEVEKRQSTSSYWYPRMVKRGRVAYGNSTYVVYRNVADYGAKGDGVTNDTLAINLAISDGVRCGLGCDSQTTTPAVIYFPPGVYMIDYPITMYYYTSLIGDALNMPTIRAFPSFVGIALLDPDPYIPGGGGANWYANQNNFYRQVRNFVLDISTVKDVTRDQPAGIHWQVAQATQLQNLVFNMAPRSPTNKQRGIFMDNGSGGHMCDLVFNGGDVCFYLGNQQFTSRNLTFNGCNTGVYLNWDWVWAFKSMTFNDCGVGLDMSHSMDQNGIVVGSATLQDSAFNRCDIGVLTSFSNNSTPTTSGSLVIDNVDMTGATIGIMSSNGSTILAGGQVVQAWAQGRVYSAYIAAKQVGNLTCYLPTASSDRIQGTVDAPPKPSVLLAANKKFFERSKPQYENEPLEAFVSIKDRGALGDGLTDDSDIIQTVLNSITTDQILFWDHGAYVISKTINVPKNIRMTGEEFPMIMIDGSSPVFSNMANPQVAWKVGQPGDIGHVEMSDMVFETRGAAPGCIILEWNVEGDQPGNAAMWEVHFRIGGTAGTLLQSDHCTKTPKVQTTADPQCIGSFLLMHVTREASVYMENVWGWVSDHELDHPDHEQINIYNGRGILIESYKGTWLYGTSFEHSMLYNYQTANARNVYMSAIQTETAYMQGNPNALSPFAPQTSWYDPDFGECFQASCYRTFGLRLYNSAYIFVYGAGLYNFFSNYDSACILTGNCQEHMVSLEKSEAVYIYALNTIATTDLVEVDKVALVPNLANGNWFCHTVSIFEFP